MANAINVPRSHLILGLSLPLAVLVGYFLAEPLELGSMAVVLAVLGVLCVPLMMRWYHPLLIFCWNSAINPVIFPGRAGLWMVMAFVGLFFAVLSRAVDPKARFIAIPSVTNSLLFLAAVVVVTAMLTGGIGIASLGSTQYGGSRYVSLLMSIAGYFALTSRRIQPQRAGLYIACFFLSGLNYAIGNFAILAGPQFHFLLYIFSPDFAQEQIRNEGLLNISMNRIGGLGVMGAAVYTYLLARYGIRGVLDLTQPWRLLVFLSAVAVGLLGGFRSYVMLFSLTFAALFFIEGLHRTRYLPILLSVALVGGAIVLPQADRLPRSAQRALSFLPGRFDAIAVESAKATVEWRVDMWKQVLPEVPKHLFCGKGYLLDPNELYLISHAERQFQSEALSGTILAGDYHNGPLSILIPFGIYGMIAFLWFLVAGACVLHCNFRFGNPAHHSVNALLLAAFVARAFFFFVGFGSLHSDMFYFVGLLGFGVALNGTDALTMRAQVEQPAIGAEMNTEYIKI